MCLTFFFYLKLWDNTLKEEKGGKRELKNTTNINREKKERKEALHFFHLWKACETKVLNFSVLVY